MSVAAAIGKPGGGTAHRADNHAWQKFTLAVAAFVRAPSEVSVAVVMEGAVGWGVVLRLRLLQGPYLYNAVGDSTGHLRNHVYRFRKVGGLDDGKAGDG